MDEDLKVFAGTDNDIKRLKKAVKVLNRAYSDLVAYAIITIHLYEEYLLNKATSKDLALAMTDLLKALPTDFAGTKLKKPRKAPRKPSKTVSPNRRTATPPSKKDEEEESSDK